MLDYNKNMKTSKENRETFNISQVNIFDIENNEIRLVINGIEYIVKIRKSKINQIHNIVINEIIKNYGSIDILNNALINDIEKFPARKNKNGDDRKAKLIADQYKISVSCVYQAQRILREAPYEILQKVRSGEMLIKTAYKLITKIKTND